MYLDYKAKVDVVVMDIARKFLQMGWTRTRRYANHKTGKKYIGPIPADKKGISGPHGRQMAPLDKDNIKAASASIFKFYYDLVKSDPDYQKIVLTLKK